MLAWLCCMLSIHTPRVFWYPYSKAKITNGHDSQMMFYWQCAHCDKILDGGYLTDYYIDENNYGEQINPLSAKEVRTIIKAKIA